MRFLHALLLATWMPSAFAAPASDARPAPMVDGDCGEYAALGARTDTIAEGVVLYAYQDRDYVWLCYTLPAQSLGMLDLRVESDALSQPLTLHVSAQLGEWPADPPGQAPQDAASPLWWNHRGWTAQGVRFNGMEPGATPARPHFRRGGARELQLSRARFGAGEWRLVFDIHGVHQADGSDATLRFPSAGVYRVLPPSAPQRALIHPARSPARTCQDGH